MTRSFFRGVLLLFLAWARAVHSFMLTSSSYNHKGRTARRSLGAETKCTCGRANKSALHALDTGVVSEVNEYLSAFAGGTVGVMGTLIALELGKEKAENRTKCPYCSGTGSLPCAQCVGTGVAMLQNPVTLETKSVPCPVCAGSKVVMCVICKGDGRSVPIELTSKSDQVKAIY